MTTTETTTPTTATALETETCSRCGGCGRYSYNSLDGDRCYGCGGTGIRYTKRGKVAHAYLESLRSVRAGTIKVGDVIRVDTMSSRYFAKVVAVGPSNCKVVSDGREIPYLDITTEHPRHGRSGLSCGYDCQVRKGWSAEEKAEQLRKAVAYQATLTKLGKPRKAARAS